jgi:hypothetical protein
MKIGYFIMAKYECGVNYCVNCDSDGFIAVLMP